MEGAGGAALGAPAKQLRNKKGAVVLDQNEVRAEPLEQGEGCMGQPCLRLEVSGVPHASEAAREQQGVRAEDTRAVAAGRQAGLPATLGLSSNPATPRRPACARWRRLCRRW